MTAGVDAAAVALAAGGDVAVCSSSSSVITRFCRLKELDYRSGRSFVCINTRESFATGDRVDGDIGVEGVSRIKRGVWRKR